MSYRSRGCMLGMRIGCDELSFSWMHVRHANWMIEHKETCRPMLRFANSDGMGYETSQSKPKTGSSKGS
ncbi:hypothetical protein Hanom_Chr07g00587741 [Helianthus anomalus]